MLLFCQKGAADFASQVVPEDFLFISNVKFELGFRTKQSRTCRKIKITTVQWCYLTDEQCRYLIFSTTYFYSTMSEILKRPPCLKLSFKNVSPHFFDGHIPNSITSFDQVFINKRLWRYEISTLLGLFQKNGQTKKNQGWKQPTYSICRRHVLCYLI